jgi:hypothetical protein
MRKLSAHLTVARKVLSDATPSARRPRSSQTFVETISGLDESLSAASRLVKKLKL